MSKHKAIERGLEEAQQDLEYLAWKKGTPRHNELQARFLERAQIGAVLFAVQEALWPSTLVSCFTDAAFELDEIDVTVDVTLKQERVTSLGTKFHTDRTCRLKIECKPTIGDDYPAVLRQIARSGAQVVVYDEFAATTVSLEKIEQIFRTRGKLLVAMKSPQMLELLKECGSDE